MGYVSAIRVTTRLEKEYRYFAMPGEIPEPSLFIWNNVGDKRRLAIIPIDCAYKYDPETQGQIVDAMNAAHGIATALELPTDSKSLAQIIMFVADNLSHLFTMPPWEEARKIIGEAKITEPDGTVSYSDIRE